MLFITGSIMPVQSNGGIGLQRMYAKLREQWSMWEKRCLQSLDFGKQTPLGRDGNRERVLFQNWHPVDQFLGTSCVTP